MLRTPPSARGIARGVIGCLSLACAAIVGAQPQAQSPLTPPANGVRRADAAWHAITNATVHTAPGKTLEKTSIVIRNGRIAEVGPADKVRTDGCQVWDGSGLHVYAGFIDAYVDVEAPQPDASAPGVHWNSRVTPQRTALDGAGLPTATADSMRRMGFTAAAIAPSGGIFRGSSAVVSLAKPISDLSADRPPVYKEDVYQVVGLSAGGFGRGGAAPSEAGPAQRSETPDYGRWPSYPGSQMGAIALIRQTLIDADWQADARKAGASIAPNAIDRIAGGATPTLVFDISDELESLRSAKIAREFGRDAVILGCGTEFRRLEAIKADGLPIILPLAYPRAPEVSGVGRADGIELSELMSWEQAPTNPRRLDAAGLKVALTSSKGRGRTEFSDNLAKAIKHGLAAEKALAMLTTTPAELLGVSDRMGTIEPGKLANLIVADGDLFDPWGKPAEGAQQGDEANKDNAAAAEEKKDEAQPDAAREQGEGNQNAARSTNRRAKIRDVWVDGLRHEINAAPNKVAVGTWTMTDFNGAAQAETGPEAILIAVTESNSITYRHKGKTGRATGVRAQDNRLDYALDSKELFEIPAVLNISAVIEGEEMHGITPMPDGSLARWTAKRTSKESTLPTERAGRGPRNREGGGAEQPDAPRGQDAETYRMTTMDGQPHQGPEGHIAIAQGSVTVSAQGASAEASGVKTEGKVVEYTLDMKAFGGEGSVKVTGERDGKVFTGAMLTPDGTSHTFRAERVEQPQAVAGGESRRGPREGGPARTGEPRKTPEQEEKEAIAAIPEKYGYPFGPYMVEALPAQKNIVFTNATIWTAGPAKNIEKGALYISEGKIEFVGSMDDWSKWLSNKRFANLETIDCKGKHIAPGIIDCHSHTGISRGVNEGGQAVTAEVRIGDVTDPDAISWYRQLAAGVTAVNNLHGSANAIGGQNQVNKIRWGVPHPDQMHLEGAKAGIKFALGENPKHSNAGDRNTTRYPQTRMGVETLIRDRFTAAREYAKTLADAGYDIRYHRLAKTGNHHARELLPDVPSSTRVLVSTSKDAGFPWIAPESYTAPKLPPRRDLELEALAEILAGERLVHCHSYRQDEILMLCRVAQDFGFKIGTFQHILEGYKVADEIAKVALGASGFSDWWAYKVEVQDAIPAGPPIMHEQGVCVSYNSDSDELARRLNAEAAKAIKYGSLTPDEAIKFVTLNAARQLAVADRIGSLEVGKDADFAVWSTSPISSMARCEATYIDGREYFSLAQDKMHREAITKERHRLMQKVLATASRGGSAGSPAGGGDRPGGGFGGGRRRPTDESRGGMLEQYYLDLMNRGGDPSAARPGECGCGLLH
jgi:imidazolonepropionase-like amidohydrolase